MWVCVFIEQEANDVMAAWERFWFAESLVVRILAVTSCIRIFLSDPEAISFVSPTQATHKRSYEIDFFKVRILIFIKMNMLHISRNWKLAKICIYMDFFLPVYGRLLAVFRK